MLEAQLLNLTADSEDGLKWEQLVASCPTSGFMQSLHWAAFKRKQNLKTLHIGLFERNPIGSQLCGGAMFYAAKSDKGSPMYVAPDGPLLPWQDEQAATAGLQQLTRALKKFAPGNNVIALRAEPRISPPLPAPLFEFGRAPVDLNPRSTLFLDLTCDDQMLLARCKPKTRYNIGLAGKKGVVVFEDSSQGRVKDFYRLMVETSRRDRFVVEPPSFFELLVEGMRESGMVKLFFAEHDQEILGTVLMITYGKRATYLYGGISNRKRNLMPGYALQWAAIRAARQAGCSEYDFYGFEEFPLPGHAYARFSRFKGGFGGQTVRYVGAHDHFYVDSLADIIVRAVQEVQMR